MYLTLVCAASSQPGGRQIFVGSAGGNITVNVHVLVKQQFAEADREGVDKNR